MTIRDAIHSVEKAGTVDFDLAGHSCTRPAAVCQGSEEEDRPVCKENIINELFRGNNKTINFALSTFGEKLRLSKLLEKERILQPTRFHSVMFGVICCHPDRFEIAVKDTMVWKPSAVQLRNVKSKNCASYFDARQIRESEAVDQARLR